MKELKLKAWHKAEKKMCDVKVITFGVGAFLIGVEKGEDYIQGNLLIHTPEEGRFCMNDEFEFLEFTGLKDKNGVCIYEGDICQAMKGEQQKPETFYPLKDRVTFWRGSFEFFGRPLSSVNTDDNGNAKSIMWCWHGHNSLPDIYEEINTIEVIGNIFQDENLLKP